MKFKRHTLAYNGHEIHPALFHDVDLDLYKVKHKYFRLVSDRLEVTFGVTLQDLHIMTIVQTLTCAHDIIQMHIFHRHVDLDIFDSFLYD